LLDASREVAPTLTIFARNDAAMLVARDRFELDTNMVAWARTVMRNGFLSDRRRDRFRADFPEDGFDAC